MDQNNTVSVVPLISSLEEAKAFLDTCTRDELNDHAFGDSEVSWYLNGKEVGWGYFGGKSSVGIYKEGTAQSQWSCEGEDARKLRKAGTTGKVERNDETGPDTFQEGRVLPGLTIEGVRKELTS